MRPEGTVEELEHGSAVPAGLSWIPIYPALKRRAIFECPFGTKEIARISQRERPDFTVTIYPPTETILD